MRAHINDPTGLKLVDSEDLLKNNSVSSGTSTYSDSRRSHSIDDPRYDPEGALSKMWSRQDMDLQK